MTAIPELTPAEFRNRWPDGPGPDTVTLVDVREPFELKLASVQGAIPIPMREIPQRLEELNPQSSIVVLCHVGGRSRQVAGFLLSAGFDDVFNLTGGIDAWSVDIDPQVPRY